MKKKYSNILFSILSVCILNNNNFLLSQNTQNNITIEDLKSPISPAFILMGISPKEIEKPQTPKAIGIMLLNSFQKGDIIPKNFSAEFSPYWLVSHPELTFDKYFNPSPWQNLKQTFSISLATSPLDSPSTGTLMGFGLHAVLLSGQLSTEVQKKFEQLKTKLDIVYKNYSFIGIIFYNLSNAKNLKDAHETLDSIKPKNSLDINTLEFVKQKIDSLNKDSLFVSDSLHLHKELDKIKTDIQSEKEKSIKQFVADLKDINEKKMGWKLEFSTAFTASSSNDSLTNKKIGFWLTPDYSWENVDILGVVRIVHENLNVNNSTNYGDIGIKGLFGNKEINFSIEVLGRYEKQTNPSYKYDLNLDYKLSDNSYLTATFGKDFDGNPSKSKGNMISILGINFGLGKDPSVKP